MKSNLSTSMQSCTFALAGAATLVLATGCQVAPKISTPVRAIWVTRYDYKTPDDVSNIIANCDDAGFNTVLFQVRGNGTAFYNSDIEPWADELGGRDPGFDPLEVAVREAHNRGVSLQAWVNVMPAWRGTKPPENPDQLYNKHPDWFWYDQNGDRQALSSFYVSLNPALPEVREYLVSVFREIVRNYDVDGLHLDYIRFPNEPPATPRGSGLDYPRDERTLKLYRAETGLAPDDDPDAWNQWRTEQVTQLVADIHQMMRRTRPRAVLSTAASVRPESATRAHFQDCRGWIDRDLVDMVFLMNYTDSPDTFRERLEPWLPYTSQTVIVPGLWFGRQPVDKGIQAVQEQIDIARELTGNFCIFSYSSLFDSRDEGEVSPRSARHHEARQRRREVLIPYMQTLAGKE